MLSLHFSNHLEPLVDHLVVRLGAAAPSPFVADEVVVPSAAVQRHLAQALAHGHGICAHVRFSFLARWLWQQVAQLVPGVQPESPFDPQVMVWQIGAAFDDPTFTRPHPRLHAYLANADAVMRYTLALRVAGLTDQYITYRPDWLQRWASDTGTPLPAEASSAAEDLAWQAALWRRLLAEQPGVRTDPVQAFVQRLAAPAAHAEAAAALPPSVHVFALPAIAPLHLGMLQALAQVMDVHLYALNPCREYWFELVDRKRLQWLAGRGQDQGHEEGQRLLAAWGRQTQAQLALLMQVSGDTVVDDAVFVDNPDGTVLGRLQNAILDLQDLAPGSVELHPDDRSLEVHVCHSLTRELEVLHNRLLGLFEADPALTPGDILVATPDLEAAAPRIEAVFGTAPPERAIAFEITGQAATRANPVASVFTALLDLVASRWVSSEVFALLQQPPVAQRFGLAEPDLERVRAWIQSAGVHWALDAEHRATHGLPAQPRHTFDDGLQRLFLGYALPSSPLEPFQDLLAAGDIEGSESLALGRFSSFVSALRACRERLTTPQLASRWPALLLEAMEQFIALEPQDLEQAQGLRAAVNSLSQAWARSGQDPVLPLAVVREALVRELDEPARGGVPGGRVTFASMSSLRGLPYRVVCVVGLDEQAFPAAARPLEFDLMALQPRLGDRQRRLDDRNVFLDLLLAARDVLHLSYTGRSARDNTALPPSVLVDELLDVLVPAVAQAPHDAGSLKRARDRLVIAHPLQAFSEDVFRTDADPRLRSYQREVLQALLASQPARRRTDTDTDTDAGAATDVPALEAGGVAAPWPQAAAAADDAFEDAEGFDDDDEASAASTAPLFTTPLPPPGPEWRNVSLEQLVRFFRHPSRYLLQQRLGLTLEREQGELDDDEPLVATSSSRRRLATRMLPALRAGLSLDEACTRALAGTEWPAGVIGRQTLAQELSDLQDFAARLAALTTEPCAPPHTVTLELEVDGQAWRVDAGFAELRSSGLVRAQPQPLREGERLDAWLHHVVLCAAPQAACQPVTHLLSRDALLRLEPCEAPREVLTELLRRYAQGLCAPLPFFPRASWAYVEHGDRWSAALDVFRPGPRTPFAEGADRDIRLAWRGLPDPFGPGRQAFHDCAHALLDPLRACLREVS